MGDVAYVGDGDDEGGGDEDEMEGHLEMEHLGKVGVQILVVVLAIVAFVGVHVPLLFEEGLILQVFLDHLLVQVFAVEEIVNSFA